MWLRLRQIALIASELAPVERDLIEILGVKVCYRDPGVAHFGLENALFPVGNQFLEVVAPVQEDTAGGRYLERRFGDGGYMVITQCDDHAPRRERIGALGVRIAHQFETDTFRNMQLHPRDTGGSFFEIDEQLGEQAHELDGPWEPAGPDWKAGRDMRRVTGIRAAELQCDDPQKVAARWSEIAEVPLSQGELRLDNARIRFVHCTDGRPEGLAGLDVRCIDPGAVLEAAERSGKRSGDKDVYLCGMRISLV